MSDSPTRPAASKLATELTEEETNAVSGGNGSHVSFSPTDWYTERPGKNGYDLDGGDA